MKIKINSRVEGGKLVSNRNTLNKAICEHEGKDITITVERKRKTRSNPQNRYYWSVIVELIRLGLKDSWGERKTREEVHEFLKARFNFTEHVNEETGEIIKIGKSTTENTTVEQEEYHEDCRQFALEWLGVQIALPNEEIEIKF